MKNNDERRDGTGQEARRRMIQNETQYEIISKMRETRNEMRRQTRLKTIHRARHETQDDTQDKHKKEATKDETQVFPSQQQ